MFQGLQGGNPDLAPERSTQYTLGGVWEPVTDSSAAIQYWNIEVRGAIGSLDGNVILYNIDVFGPTNVVRNPPEVEHPTLPGPIRYIILYQQNVDRLTLDCCMVDMIHTPI